MKTLEMALRSKYSFRRNAFVTGAFVVSLLFLLALAGCASGYSKPSTPVSSGVTVTPATATVQVGGSQQFNATVTGSTTNTVTWSTNGGTISSSGMYTAPSGTGVWTVTATSTVDSTLKGTAIATVTSAPPPPPGSVTISPSSVLVQPGGQQQFTSNVAVNWTASGGSINSSGLYTAPNTNGTFTVTATDKTNSSNSASATVNVAPPPAPGGVNGWANRVSGINIPGGGASVLSAQSFDSFPVSNKQQYFQLYDPSSITSDCTIASDGCSLKLAILQGYKQGEPGWFDWNFSPDLSKTFGEGQEFYVQYKERLDPGMLNGANFPNGEGFKHDIITEGDTNTVQAGDCSNSPGEVVTIQDQNGGALPTLYHNCGFSGGTFAFMQNGYQPIQLGGAPNSNFLDQNASGCPHYSGRGIPTTEPTCWNYVGNEWFTVQVHVKVGTFGNPNSVLEVWFAHQGQPARLLVNAADAALVNDSSGGASGKYGKIQISAYNTNMSGSMVNTAVWFDDLMASTRRIPDPDVATPNAPDSLSLSGVAKGTVTVNWRVNSHNSTSQDDTGFLVERCTGTGVNCFSGPQSGFAQIGTTAAGASSYVDTSVVSGTTYTYRVRAQNAAGNSAYAIAQCFNSGNNCGGTVVAP